MKRITPTFFIFALLLILVIDVYISDGPALLSEVAHADAAVQAASAVTLDGTVTYHQVVPLSDNAGLVVLLKEVRIADGQEVVLGAQTASVAGKRIPFEFSIPYNPESIRADGVYVVEARILSHGKSAFEMASMPVGMPEQGAMVDLTLARVAPWTSLELALSSGRLSRSSIGQPQFSFPSAIASAP